MESLSHTIREANLLVALEQLRVVKTLIAEFETRPPFMPPLSTIQAQYIAIVAMLRPNGLKVRLRRRSVALASTV
jgi:hypothetical protein